jgi:hypothetical protein
MSKIEIRRWDVLDIYYYEADEDSVRLLLSEYEQKGWSIEIEGDIAGNKDYELSAQLMKMHKIKSKKL